MMKEDKELLFKDLCGRLPYGVIIETKLINAPRAKYPALRFLKSYMLHDFWQRINNVITMPYLRPMSSMTDEEKEYIKNRWCCEDWDDIYDFLNHYQIDAADAFDLVDWLNAHLFDYRGLIERGLALKAKEGMYGKETEK